MNEDWTFKYLDQFNKAMDAIFRDAQKEFSETTPIPWSSVVQRPVRLTGEERADLHALLHEANFYPPRREKE